MAEHKYVFTYKYDQGNGTYIEDFTLGSNKSKSSRYSFFQDEYKQVVDLIENKVNKDNNLILFTGRRGAGKTSAMCSIKNYLEKSGESRDKLQNYRFFILPVVDPSYFDQKTNVLKVVLSSMFKEAKRIFQESRDSNNGYEKLLKSFDKAFRGLGSIETADKGKYTLETLNEYSEATDMKDTMQKLVNRFVEFWNNERFKQSDERTKKMSLVLIIDDVDMNVSYAAAMLEQIRKYLMLDNFIILMSANLGQLHNELIEYYCSAFQKTLKDANQSLMIEVEDLATKFLLKMIPASHRIHVENPAERLLETELQIVNKKNETRNGPFQKMILTMIWERTRLLFFPKGAEKGENAIVALHPIIPTNLRELSYFLEMLISLKPLDYCADNIFKDLNAYERCKKNFYKFKDYFLKNWIPNRLSADEEWAFKNMPSDITEINKHLINSINIIGTKHKKWLMSREMGIDTLNYNGKIDHDIYTMVSPNDPSFEKANEISDIKQQSSNCSYGDLLFMIDKYETYFESKEDRYFSDAIRIFYSMLLFETMFFESNNIKYGFKEFRESMENQELEKTVIPIQRLIGGTVYYPYHFSPIYSKYFDNIESPFETKTACYHRIPISKDKTEYPLFSLLYYGYSRPDRCSERHVYDTTFKDSGKEGSQFVNFDILSLLNNILNPWHTFFRLENPINERITKNIDNWGKLCLLEETKNSESKVTFPNSILPFYSVDLMLLYLKDSLKASIFFYESKSDEKRYEVFEKIASFYTIWFKPLSGEELLDKIDEELLDKIDEGSFAEVKRTISSIKAIFRILIKEEGSESNKTDTTSGEISKGKEGKGKAKKEKAEKEKAEKEKKDMIKENRNYRFIFSNLEILWTVRQKTQDYSNDNLDSYKALVKEQVIVQYYDLENIKNQIISKVDECYGIFEIYNYLVKTLWRDSIMDIAVRKSIQGRIRNKVDIYYDKLWMKTSALFDNISVDANKMISSPYKTIFNKAFDCFLKERNNEHSEDIETTIPEQDKKTMDGLGKDSKGKSSHLDKVTSTFVENQALF